MSGADFRYIGQPLPRKEDRRFLIGAGCYIDDIEVPGVLHACFVRSPHAQARIAQHQQVAVRQPRLLVNPAPVHQRSVARTEVGDHQRIPREPDAAVMARHPGVGQDDAG